MKNEQIKILDFVTFKGRNIYSQKPVMKMTVDIGELKDIPTRDIQGFNQRLLNAFPGLKSHCCGLGYSGGFLDRLNSGTYIAHVLEHLILEMQAEIGYDVRYGKTRVLDNPSEYYLVYEYQNEVCGLECGKTAVFILNYFLNGKDVSVDKFLEYLKKISINAELGPSTCAIVEEAKRRGLPVTRIGNESLVRIGYGKHSRIIESTLTDATPCIAADISSNKQLTKSILSEHHIPVPYGKVVYSEISAVIAASQLGMPVVIKPSDGNQGKGVYLDLNSEDEIRQAFREASRYGGGVIVEKHVRGRDYRVLVVGSKVSAVAERLPAMVIGDGEHTIKELVDIVNQDENRGEHHEKPLTKIKLDSVSENLLKKNEMDFCTVPQKGQVVKLRTNGNLSTGGTAIDCTDIIHPENAELAVLAANAIGIDIAGIDMVTNDISKSIVETGGVIVEVNTAPGIRMHLYPSKGKPRNVAVDIVDHLFEDPDTYNFPIVSVTGTNGKTTVVRLIVHVLSLLGKTVGMTTTSGTFVGEKCICKGDNSGPCSARTLLSNKSIDVAVLETARGGILREGLGYDLADVGIVLNISDDHLGYDGIDTLEDLAFVKSVVAEAVKKGGHAVFNADDPMTPFLIGRTKSDIILFSKSRIMNPGYRPFIHVCADGGWIKLTDGEKAAGIVRVSDIPITLGGLIDCNIENCLAAAAALYSLKVPLDVIAAGLKSFKTNAGRFNIYDIGGFMVMLDYAHNLAGYKQAVKACGKIGCLRLIGVVGMPGDRTDESIKSVGRFCAGAFDKIYIKEDVDKRGRKPFEVAKILYDEILKSGFDKNNATIIESETEALRAAVRQAKQGDLIAVFYESLEPLQEYIRSCKAKKPTLQTV